MGPRVYAIKSRLQYYKFKLKGQFCYRWISTFALACFYGVRVYLHGYLIVTFYLACSLSCCAILVTDTDDDKHGVRPILPIQESDELRPFVPLILNEFTIWVIVNMLFCVASSLTFIPKLNYYIPMYPYGYMFIVAWYCCTITMVVGLRDPGEYKGKLLLLVVYCWNIFYIRTLLPPLQSFYLNEPYS